MTQWYLGVISEARHDIANTLGELFAEPEKIGAGDGNRTHVSSLGSRTTRICPMKRKNKNVPLLPAVTVEKSSYPKL